MLQDRWPPIYDTQDLEQTIQKIQKNIFEGNYSSFYATDSRQDSSLCQGSIIEFVSAIPVIDEEGTPSILSDHNLWLVIGNTCDISRNIDVVSFTNLIPIYSMQKISQKELSLLTRYNQYRKFYIPNIDELVPSPSALVADFTIIVTTHKDALNNKAKILRNMSFDGWLLLHSCLVRYLARDDGRHDNTKHIQSK